MSFFFLNFLMYCKVLDYENVNIGPFFVFENRKIKHDYSQSLNIVV